MANARFPDLGDNLGRPKPGGARLLATPTYNTAKRISERKHPMKLRRSAGVASLAAAAGSLVAVAVAIGGIEPRADYPPQKGPQAFSLAVGGTVAQGATVKFRTLVHHPFGLVVAPVTTPPSFNTSRVINDAVRFVPLGTLGPGAISLHWNLTAGGKQLAPGAYGVTVEYFLSDGEPEGLSPPRPLLLTVHRDGRVSARAFPG